MSPITWIIVFICAGWIVGCYYFLFRKGNESSTTSKRSERDVITFHSPKPNPSIDPLTPNPDFPDTVTPYTETISIAESQIDSAIANHSQINDEDLIDIRTLSLNITNQN